MNIPVDELWFERLCSISAKNDDIEWFKQSMHVDAETREQFFADDIENPKFSYTARSSTRQERVQDTEDLLAEITATEKDAIVLDLYQRKLKNQLLRHDLIDATIVQDDQKLYDRSQELYGKPKKKYFTYIAKRLQRLCNTAAEVEYPARSLCKITSKINTKTIELDVDVLPPLVEGSPLISSIRQVEEIFGAALEQYKLAGWQLRVDPSGARTRFSVSNEYKVVHIPSEAQLLKRATKLTVINVEALAAHEIGVHARRSAAGETSKLQLLSVGLAGYLTGEEGVAGYVQQQVEGATEFYGFDRYMAAAFAVGLDGLPRDFRGVFSIMVDYYVLQFARTTGVVNKSVKLRAKHAAWEVCTRIFRGTTGKTPGCIYTRDLAYLEGNIGIWNLLSDKPHVFADLFVGKYNPLDSHQVRSLQDLHILKEW